MTARWTGGVELQRDRDLLQLLNIDVVKLTAAEIRLGAELVRQITDGDDVPGADQRRGAAIDRWKHFRGVKDI